MDLQRTFQNGANFRYAGGMAKKRPAERLIRLVSPPDPVTGVGVLCLSIRRRQTFYTFKEIPCDIGGRGFLLHRLGLGELYHVRIGNPEESSCECLGFLRHGHCKHIQGLTMLISHGVLRTLNESSQNDRISG
jgi:hypothetical protein